MAEQADSSNGTATAPFVCPECGREFSRPAALGAHRSRVHGVAGSSRSAGGAAKSRSRGTRSGATRQAGTAPARSARPAAATARRRRRATPANASASISNGRSGGADRGLLLRALFPNGLPPNETLIAGVGAWLDEADRLVRMR
jgi:hypothetical protein